MIITLLGPIGLLAVLLGFALMLVAIVVVYASRPVTIASFLPLTFIPLLLGCLSVFIAVIQGLTVIGSSTVAPKPSEFVEMVGAALAAGIAGLVATLIPFSILAAGLAVKSWIAEYKDTSSL